MQKIPLLNKFADEKRWLNWTYANKDGKRTKVPIGSSTDPETWSKYSDLKRKTGVGIVFTPDQTLLGIDIDHCLKGLEIVHEKKETIVNFLIETDTYTEISPSGEGLHVFLALTGPLNLSRHKFAPFEAYTSGRFFTVTGEAYKEEKEVRTVSPEEAIRLLSLTGDEWMATSRSEEPKDFDVNNDDALLEKMFGAENGERVRKLFDGDISDYKNDRSSADMALCSHLAFWTGGDAKRMDRLWLRSSLSNRDKAIVRKDYRPRTIAAAIKNCKKFYEPRKVEVKGATKAATADRELVFIDSSEIRCKEISWLWKDKIAKGKVTLIAGEPGLGKSQTTVHMASIVSTGGEFPGGERCDLGKVLMFSSEDDPADTVVPRLVAYGADLKRISIFSMVKKSDGEGYFNLSTDIKLLRERFKKDREISFVILDPISAFLGETDSHNNAEVRALLYQLSKAASEFNVAIVGVTHFNKSSTGGPMNKFMGSLAFVAAARAAYIVTKDPNDESRRLFLPVKNNLADDKGGYAYRVEPVRVEKDGISIDTSRVVWEKDGVTMNAVEALRETTYGGVNNQTVEWLEDYLKKYPEGVSTDRLYLDAKRNGISKATLYRAAEKTFVEKIYVARDKPRLWKLAIDDWKPDSEPI
jgi:putative DNA primase/helicase